MTGLDLDKLLELLEQHLELDWQISPTTSQSNSSTATEFNDFITPSPEKLRALLELVNFGKMKELLQQVDLLTETDSPVSADSSIFKSFKISRTHLVRYVRRRSSRIDSVDDIETKDKKKTRVKSLLITAFKATRKQRYSLRKALSEHVRKELTEYTADAFLLSVAVGKFQMKIKKKMNKIYPVRYSEIRAIEIR